MSILGKIHEISFYGLITTIVCLINRKITLNSLLHSAFHPENFSGIFLFYLFWGSVLFIPIAIIGAFYTRYSDNGEGLTFFSDNIVVIIFAHIGEELLGLVLTPFWVLKYLFTKTMTGYRALDSTLYALELIFIFIGVTTIW